MNTYITKTERFANDRHFARCANKAELDAMVEHGWTRITRKEAARSIAWVNAENRSWGSGNAFGFQRMVDLVNAPEYAASVILAELEN